MCSSHRSLANGIIPRSVWLANVDVFLWELGHTTCPPTKTCFFFFLNPSPPLATALPLLSSCSLGYTPHDPTHGPFWFTARSVPAEGKNLRVKTWAPLLVEGQVRHAGGLCPCLSAVMSSQTQRDHREQNETFVFLVHLV